MKCYLGFFCWIICTGLHAQSIQPYIINPAGGWLQDAGGAIVVEWSLGEPAISTLSGNDLITQGFLQPIFLDAAEPLPQESIDVYPNPASERVFLLVGTSKIKRINIQDLTGKILINQQFSNEINIEAIPDGLYLFSFFDDKNRVLATRSIMKIKAL